MPHNVVRIVFGRLFCEYGGFEMKLNLKSVLTGSAATVALVAASSASASGYYIGLFGGISTMEDDFTVATSTAGGSSTSAGTTFAVTYGVFLTNTLWSNATWDTRPNYNGTTYYKNSNKYTITAIGSETGLTGESGIGLITTFNSLTVGARSTAFGVTQGFDDGFVVGGAIGWDFGNGWRSELEVAYRNHDLEDASVQGSFSRAYTHYDTLKSYYYFATYQYTAITYVGLNTITRTGYIFANSFTTQSGKSNFGTTGAVNGSAGGELDTWSFMMNVWYDFDFGDSPIHPFIGGGIGFAHAALDFNMGVTGLPNTLAGLFGTTASYRGNGEATDWGFAYQAGAGLGYDLGNGMMLSAQYRYFNTGAMDLSLADQIEVNLESHNFLVGLNIPLGGGM